MRGDAIDAAAVQNASVVDQASLNAVRTVLETRAEEEKKYRSGVYSYGDPSQ